MEGHVILPKGTPATGIVGKVQRAVPGKKDGHVVVTAGSIQLPSGQSVPMELWMTDREDCDGEAGACATLAVLAVIILAPLLAIQLPVMLAHPKKTFRGDRDEGVESILPAGSEVRAFIRRNVKVPTPNAAIATASR